MRRTVPFLGVLALAACSELPTTGDGVVALELLVPASLTLPADDSLQLRARALDRHAQEVPAVIRWATADTLTIALDSITGMVHPLVTTGSARIQARVGSLRSDPIAITIQAP